MTAPVCRLPSCIKVPRCQLLAMIEGVEGLHVITQSTLSIQLKALHTKLAKQEKVHVDQQCMVISSAC